MARMRVTGFALAALVAVAAGPGHAQALFGFLRTTLPAPAARDSGANDQTRTSTHEQTTAEKAVLAEINWARAHPAAYAEELRAFEQRFTGKIERDPGDPTGIVSQEGVPAVAEAAAFVAAQPPRAPIGWSDLLSAAARDHAIEQAATNTMGHFGPDGSTPSTRVQRRGGGRYVGEVIAYGGGSAASVVRLLIVDDGVRSRGHRMAIFSDQYKFAGVACGPHPTYRDMCVADLAMTADGNYPIVTAALIGK
jgi:uncharacterized protein YkwD